MDIELQTRALQLKAILNKINDASYAYSQLSRTFPFQSAVTNEDLKKICKAYSALIDDLTSYLKTTNHGKYGMD